MIKQLNKKVMPELTGNHLKDQTDNDCLMTTDIQLFLI